MPTTYTRERNTEGRQLVQFRWPTSFVLAAKKKAAELDIPLSQWTSVLVQEALTGSIIDAWGIGAVAMQYLERAALYAESGRVPPPLRLSPRTITGEWMVAQVYGEVDKTRQFEGPLDVEALRKYEPFDNPDFEGVVYLRHSGCWKPTQVMEVKTGMSASYALVVLHYQGRPGNIDKPKKAYSYVAHANKTPATVSVRTAHR